MLIIDIERITHKGCYAKKRDMYRIYDLKEFWSEHYQKYVQRVTKLKWVDDFRNYESARQFVIRLQERDGYPKRYYIKEVNSHGKK